MHELQHAGDRFRLAMLSDIHWDNPKCDWERLTRDLDYCKDNNIPVMVNGDMFCLMQGKGDRRSNKSDIRSEHNNSKYLDSIVTTAVDFFAPYKDLLTVIGYGNHETAIIKHQETDILQRFVDLFNHTHGANVHVGGYGGWLILKLDNHSTSSTIKVKYFHGSGGGGIVTKGAINLTRALEINESFDVFAMGHIHENAARNDVRDTLEYNASEGYIHVQKDLHMMITGAYKEEYGDGSQGWHVERGAPAKPVGGRILDFSFVRRQVGDTRKIVKHVDSYKFVA